MDPRIFARLQPTRRKSGLRIPGQYVWCSSVVRAEGKWHMFSSAWPQRQDGEQYSPVELLQNYWRLSTIVRAEADHPEGPYAFQEVVLTGQGAGHWATECCHNPCIVRVADRFVLYFQTKGQEHDDRRIGYATASSVHGPWTLADSPLDLGFNVTNPAALVEDGGRVRLAFRTPGMKIAIAEAEAYDGDYRIVNADICPGIALEDPFLYTLDGQYHLLLEDNRGQWTGHVRHGVHLVSRNGVDFGLFEPEPRAYSHTVAWQDGGSTTFDRRERPWLVIQDGRPTHLVTGVLLGQKAWSVVQPLDDTRLLQTGEE